MRRQTVRSNEQMMQSMKGATMLLGSMNRQMNLPALQRITMEFERENEIMDERQEMMDDAIDEATGMEDDEAEGEDIVREVLDEIGVDLTQAVRAHPIQPFLLTKMLTILPSWARHLLARSKKNQLVMFALLRLSAGEVVAVHRTLVTMISRRVWTASDAEWCSSSPPVPLLPVIPMFLCFSGVGGIPPLLAALYDLTL